MLISESITKIRRLVNDDSSVIFSDAKIRKLFGREQQDFCRRTSCLTKAVSLLAPPELDYAFCFGWEEGFGDGRLFCPFFKDSSYVCSQPFEQSEGYDLAGDGNTLTSGVDMLSSDPQHPIPFFMPDDYYSPQGIFWDYKWVEQESFENVSSFYVDRWHNRGDVVDYFCHAKGLRKKAIYLKNMPYDFNPERYIDFDSEANKIVDDYGLDAKEFSDWVANRCSITADSTTAPDGSATGVKLTEDATAANTHQLNSGAGTIIDDTLYTWSVFLKSGTKNRCIIRAVEENPWTDDIELQVDMDAGTITEASSGDITLENSSITAYPNDWYLVTMTGQFGSAASNQHQFVIYLTETNSNFITTYDGDGSSYIYIWGAKMTQTPSYEDERPFYSSGRTLVGNEIQEDTIYSFYSSVPERPTATSDEIEVQVPFAKYIEYKVASRLMKSDTELRDEIKAKHYALRSEIGIQFVKRITNKLLSGKELRVGGILQGRGGRPPAPRFPDHYPAVRIR